VENCPKTSPIEIAWDEAGFKNICKNILLHKRSNPKREIKE